MHNARPFPDPLAAVAPLPLCFVSEAPYDEMALGLECALPYLSAPDDGLRTTPFRAVAPASFQD